MAVVNGMGGEVPQLGQLPCQQRNISNNDSKCIELDWVCIPMAVEYYGAWRYEAQNTFSRLATHLAIKLSMTKSQGTIKFVLTLSK